MTVMSGYPVRTIMSSAAKSILMSLFANKSMTYTINIYVCVCLCICIYINNDNNINQLYS